ncbi:MAG: alanine racemase [Chloroflexi bacterium]|nr:alanine racemase [Chloroflexota bacterium]
MARVRTPVAIPDVRRIRATRAIVNLDAIEANVRALRTALPNTCKLMAVVKADGYGHGAPWIARAALISGASLLGVATVWEGQTLRAHGISAPIVLLGSIDAAEAESACQTALEITVADETLLVAVQRAVRSQAHKEPMPVHLKIDTGLRRYGATAEAAAALAAKIAADPLLRLASVFTHFASADEPSDPFTREQLKEFQQAVATIRADGAPLPPLHTANSAGILTGMGTHYDIARAGIALYGVPPSVDVALKPGMRPALSVESRITRIIPVAPGDTVGYNRTFRAAAPMRGALVPIGYADGYRRALSGRAWVGIDGRRAPVLGRVSMDQIVVEVPGEVEATVGDVVQIFGGGEAAAAPSVVDMAELMGSNAYEVIVGLRARVPRVFIRNGEVVAVSDAIRIGVEK